MHTEVLGPYQIELSARQIIDHGGWAAFAAIHAVPSDDTQSLRIDSHTIVFQTQRVASETVFESEEAAIEGARRAAIAFLKSGNTYAQQHMAASPAAPADCSRASDATHRSAPVPPRPTPSRHQTGNERR